MPRTPFRSALVLISSLLASLLSAEAQESTLGVLRSAAQQAQSRGLYKEAFDGFKKILLEHESDASSYQDLRYAIQDLNSLGRIDEADAFLESVVARHPSDPKLLMEVAQRYNELDHNGFIISGEFSRGYHRGGGRQVSSLERDRVRALQLLMNAHEVAATMSEGDRSELYSLLANVLTRNDNQYEAWKLQSLTDLATLPDYDEPYYGYYGNAAHGAPVDLAGSPIFYTAPASFNQAESDGERYRWALTEYSKTSEYAASAAEFRFANFLRLQFDVQTLGNWFISPFDRDDKESVGTFTVHTLKEDETIARLATGPKRFHLPDEFNFIKIFQSLADRQSGYAQNALQMLGVIFSDRRQYPRAAHYISADIKLFEEQEYKRKALNQIIGAWGQFEPVAAQPAGKNAVVDFKFRNGRSVKFEAFEIEQEKLIQDTIKYLESDPGQVDYTKVNIQDLGTRLVTESETRYIGEKVASWAEKLDPRENHFDRRITVKTPLTKGGVYLLRAEMAGGNTSNLVVWIADTLIVKKPLNDSSLYVVVDGATGKPVNNAKLDFFGYKSEYINTNNLINRILKNLYKTTVRKFTLVSDQNGEVIAEAKDLENGYNWLVTANTEEGRFAQLGFSYDYLAGFYSQSYDQAKTYVITDRPVYRPSQEVKFKLWLAQARYGEGELSSYAKQRFTVQVRDPKGETFTEQTLESDEFGGVSGAFALPEGATLGLYSIGFSNFGGSGSFRVEEYKKPEYEVSIDAPSEPVALGEKITATIKAKYYFGSPVTEAKVHYKILRHDHSANWYPPSRWDWFYGPGYWWFSYNYSWLPGWRFWGCESPIWWWWYRPAPPPELIAEADAEISSDGTLKIEIDTAIAKELHPDTDHRYEITAEVVDRSRRTIVGTGSVLVAKKPFAVHAWVDRGYYKSGDAVKASFVARTLDGKPVSAPGQLKLMRLSYKDGESHEEVVEEWKLPTDSEGNSSQQISAAAPGQYRLSYTVKGSKGHSIEGGYLFTVIGESFDSASYRFNDIELIPDKQSYAPGEKVKLMINVNQPGATVLLFVRPENGRYLAPEVIRMEGKSALREISVSAQDMPNFFIEAVTVHDAQVFSETRQIVVPPESRALNVEVIPSAAKFKPGEKASIGIKVTDSSGAPFSGSAVLTVYDRALEYISGGSNVPEIKEFFWKWLRRHTPVTQSSVDIYSGNVAKNPNDLMMPIGIFGESVADELESDDRNGLKEQRGDNMRMLARKSKAGSGLEAAAPMSARSEMVADQAAIGGSMADNDGGSSQAQAVVQPTIRRNLADTAYWIANLTTDSAGKAQVEFTMPENLSEWKIRSWVMGQGTRVGEGTASIVTTKNLLVRLQAPRFFVEKDELVISANIHNYLKSSKRVTTRLEFEGANIELLASKAEQVIEVGENGEARVDWRVKVIKEGEAVIRVSALTDEESDAMEMRYPVFVHGMLKTDSVSGAIPVSGKKAEFTIKVPEERRPDQSRLEIRYSPSLAMAMVDALPYLASYPYGCTEQTLSRFLPTVITEKILSGMGLNLESIREKRANLNAQEIGDDKQRAKQWKRFPENPVFDRNEISRMAHSGINRLLAMQLSDGGWGWFSGREEQSSAHTTAYVVHGLQIAKEVGLDVPNDTLSRGLSWLKNYQAGEIQKLSNYPTSTKPNKQHADALDAFVDMVLVDGAEQSKEMQGYLWRDRVQLAVYAKALFGLALQKVGEAEKVKEILKSIEQFLIQDDENQTAYLKLPESNYWWYWYGSEYEAQSYYLKLLARANPKSQIAPRLVKYLLNNRKNSTYWNSTRDTAITIEAFADYIRAVGEDKPDLKIEILIDGKRFKEVTINAENLFTYDNVALLSGTELSSGEHKIEIVKSGKGSLYFNAYLTNFTLEDYITKAGLEIKVDRKFYKLKSRDKSALVAGGRGQALNQKVEAYERIAVENLDQVKSGDLIEIELSIESKNDYEYLIFEDMKAAGFEPVEVQSGYNGNDLGAYVEYRDERVAFFMRALARGKHSVSYRLRAEIPGKFSALPTRAYAMYAPELKANSDEIKVGIDE